MSRKLILLVFSILMSFDVMAQSRKGNEARGKAGVFDYYILSHRGPRSIVLRPRVTPVRFNVPKGGDSDSWCMGSGPSTSGGGRSIAAPECQFTPPWCKECCP